MRNSILTYISITFALFLTTDIKGENIVTVDSLMADSAVTADGPKRNIFKQTVKSVLDFFSPAVDTAYIEPQKYNLCAMVQNTNEFDLYTISSGNEYSMNFSPESRVKFGPYFGWRWAFFGYTFDVAIADLITSGADINFNFYTAAVGINLIYRHVGGYKFGSLKVGNMDLTSKVNGMAFPEMDTNTEGVNLYYVLNSKEYSHQAAYSQTNRQIRNAGSLIVGLGYDHNLIKTDWKALSNVINTVSDGKATLSTPNIYDKLDYSSVSLSAGYGYNWVFAKNWLLGSQAIGSVTHLWTNGKGAQGIGDDNNTIHGIITNFSLKNFTLDGGLRLGVVWNNSRWFAGMSGIFNTFTYHNDKVWTSNNFGTLNFYVGYNFWKMK